MGTPFLGRAFEKLARLQNSVGGFQQCIILLMAGLIQVVYSIRMQKQEKAQTSTQPDEEPPRTKITKQQIMQEYAELKRVVDQRKQTNTKATEDKLNKTAIGKVRAHREEELGEEIEEYRMISAMAVSKKKENYHQLKKWDQHRSEVLGVHRAAIDELQAQLDKRVKASIDNVEAYCQFFREKAKQEEKFAQHSIIDPRAATKDNPIATNIYINCTSLLNVLGEHSQEESRRIQQFATSIKKDILKERLEEHLNHSQLQLLKVRERISTLKSHLQKLNAQTEHCSQELAVYYNQHSQDVTTFNSEKDFYRDQLAFLRRAEEQSKTQKKLGEACLQYLKVATQEEQKRMAVVKEAILIYVDAMRDAYKTIFQQPELDDLRKKQEHKLVPWFYSLEEMLSSRTLRVIKDRLKLEAKSQLSLALFQDFLNRYDSIIFRLTFQEFDTRTLVLKQYTVVRDINKEVSEPCTIVVTVDGFLQLFYSRQNIYEKPNITFKINQSLVLKPVSDMKLQLGRKDDRKRSSMMSFLAWDTKLVDSVLLRFPKRDTREQFADYVRKIM